MVGVYQPCTKIGKTAAMPKIITVAAYKGGVGKTTLALELAQLLDAPLVDLDWDKGGATNRWGYREGEMDCADSP